MRPMDIAMLIAALVLVGLTAGLIKLCRNLEG